MPMTRGSLVVVILGLAAAAGAVGELARLSLMSSPFSAWSPAAAVEAASELGRMGLTPALFPAWSPVAAAIQSLQTWELQGPVLEWLGGIDGVKVSLKYDYVPPVDEGESPGGYLSRKEAEKAQEFARQAKVVLVK